MDRVTIRRALRAALDLKYLTVATAVAIVLGCGGPAAAVPADEAIGTPDQYSTAKARTLASTHHSQLVSLYDSISTCLPWVNVNTRGIGFRKPKWAQEDDRYLTTWVLIDQKDDARFGALPVERRASAMFSRYGVDLLRRMTALKGVAGDGGLQGYGVVLSWTKPGSDQKVNESLVFWVDKATAQGFVARRVPAADLVSRAKLNYFDGTDEHGRITLEVWEDNFTTTFKVKDTAAASAQTC
jgi:hypothetical protein